MDGAFVAPQEICPDGATCELMGLTALFRSMMSYRQASKVLAKFLRIEPTERYATVRKRTIRIRERLDDPIVRETWKARAQADDRRHIEMQVEEPYDRTEDRPPSDVTDETSAPGLQEQGN